MYISSLDNIGKYILQKQPTGLIVDTNILLLFLIGSYNPIFIKDCALVSQYSVEDFELLKKVFERFQNRKIIITPQIIAEVSNLSMTKMYGDKLHYCFQVFIRFLRTAEEHHQKSDCLWGMELQVLGKYGFTDLTIFELAKNNHMIILTDEEDFFNYSYTKGVPVMKFSHFKYEKYQSILT